MGSGGRVLERLYSYGYKKDVAFFFFFFFFIVRNGERKSRGKSD